MALQRPLVVWKHIVDTLRRRTPFWIDLIAEYQTCKTIQSTRLMRSRVQNSRINQIDQAMVRGQKLYYL